MTEDEHRLIVSMFVQQSIRFKALLEILKSRGLLEGDDFAAFEDLTQKQVGDEMLRATIDQYTEFAKDFGLQDSLPKPGPY